jgi:hypothetical protein
VLLAAELLAAAGQASAAYPSPGSALRSAQPNSGLFQKLLSA